MVETLKPPKRGFLRFFGCGEFIRDYLWGYGPHGSAMIDQQRGAPIEDIRFEYNDALLRAHVADMVAVAMGKGIDLSEEEAARRLPRCLSRVCSASFYRYFHNLKRLGWVEATGEEKRSSLGGLSGDSVEGTSQGTTVVEVPQSRCYYRITPKGIQASDADWRDPLQAFYHYPRQYRSGTKTNSLASPIKLPSKGNVKR